MFEHYKYDSAKDKQKNNSILLLSFVVSIVLLFLYGAGYRLAGRILSNILPSTGSLLLVWGPPVGIGVLISLLLCICNRWISEKRMLPYAMTFLLLYYVVLAAAILLSQSILYPKESLYLLSFYALPCLVPGNLLSWLQYHTAPKKRGDCR